MAGVHLPKPLHVVATVAEYVAEVIHHPTGDLAEKMVCGTGVTLIKETINNAVATQAAILAGTTASITTSPVGGAIIAGTVGMVVHDTTNKVITEPLSHLARNLCHDIFENLPSENHKSNNQAFIDYVNKGELSEIKRLVENGGDIFIKDAKEAFSLLHYAAKDNHPDVIKFLV